MVQQIDEKDILLNDIDMFNKKIEELENIIIDIKKDKKEAYKKLWAIEGIIEGTEGICIRSKRKPYKVKGFRDDCICITPIKKDGSLSLIGDRHIRYEWKEDFKIKEKNNA